MNEIYRDTSKKIFLDVYGANATNVTATLRGKGNLPVQAEATDSVNLLSVNSSFSAYIGLEHTNTEQTLYIDWNFLVGGESTTVTYIYDVVTPYVSTDDIFARYPELVAIGKTVDDAAAMERRVRNIINTYCGQSFGYKTSTETVIANGGSSLNLPERLLSVTNLNVDGVPYNINTFAIRGGGWTLGRYGGNYDVYSYATNVPIYAPQTDRYIYDPTIEPKDFFRDNKVVEITGIWGYERVPGEISEAAMILIGDYYCSDSTYRDRYVGTMRYADTTVQFHEGAFRGTGNIQADQLLNNYKISRMLIV